MKKNKLTAVEVSIEVRHGGCGKTAKRAVSHLTCDSVRKDSHECTVTCARATVWPFPFILAALWPRSTCGSPLYLITENAHFEEMPSEFLFSSNAVPAQSQSPLQAFEELIY